MHYKSQDTWSAAVSCCLDWRAEIHLSALDAHHQAPDVVAGFVHFLVLQLGQQPVAEVLELYGDHAVPFDQHCSNTPGWHQTSTRPTTSRPVPISAVLLILNAEVDGNLAHPDQLRPWAVSQVAHTMLPTTAGVMVMKAFPSSAPLRGARRLVAADHIDRDWPRVGCISIPGHPYFLDERRPYTCVDDARAELDAVRGETFRASAQQP